MVQPILVLGGLGLVFGILLTLFYLRFRVEENPLIAGIHDLLPKANCGACGYPGCGVFAEMLAAGKVTPDRCAGIEPEALKQICRILGTEEVQKVKRVARVCCAGGPRSRKRFGFDYLPDCRALNALFDTDASCAYACLGLGSCVRACPFGALRMEEGLPVVIEEKCVACGKCVDVCPKGILHICPLEKRVYIACSSHDRGSRVMKVCEIGCIGCGKCVRACPVKAISLQENLAVIDYELCTGCQKCVDECPRKVILVSAVAEHRLA